MSGSKERPQSQKKELERNGMIPGWADVCIKFKLKELPPPELKVMITFCRGQRRVARGQGKRGRETLAAVAEKDNFKTLEERDPDFLNQVATYIRKHGKEPRGGITKRKAGY